jgi:serine/threonine-protein kinase
MFAHLEAPVPTVTSVAPDVPAAFDEVIARAMAKDASARYASAGELGRAAVDAAAG